MLKRLSLFALSLFFSLSLLPVSAQAPSWRAWLYDSISGRMMLVGQAGLIEEHTLPMPEGYDGFPNKVAVSHGGTLFAYVANNYTAGQQSLMVYDTVNRAIKMAYGPISSYIHSIDLGESGPNMFDPTDNALAFGFSFVDAGWQIVILDLTTNSIMPYTLTAQSPEAVQAGLDGGFGMTPIIQRFIGADVTFAMVQGGTEGSHFYPNFTWNFLDATIAPSIMYPSLDTDTFEFTGEVVMPFADDRLANQSANFPFGQANSLHVYDPITGGRFPVYNNPAMSLYWPRFIEGGQRVLVTTSDINGTQSWQLIGRDGSSVAIVEPLLINGGQISSMDGVVDGFVYTLDAPDGSGSTLAYANTMAAGPIAPIAVWSSQPGMFARLVWVDDPRTPPIMAQSTTSWIPLAEAEYAPAFVPAQAAPAVAPTVALVDPLKIPTPTLVSGLAGPTLSIGTTAVVNTTSGDRLNVRSAAGTDYDIVTRLDSGAFVTILEGPRSNNGFTWWRIRTADGIEGWVVESIEDDDGTRLFTLTPRL